MQWIEVTVRTTIDEKDTVADLLQDFGGQGVSIDHEGIPADRFDDDELPLAPMYAVKIYLREDERSAETQGEIEALLADHGYKPLYRHVDDQDWAEAWKAHYHTTRIGKRLIIRPLWEEYEVQAGDLVISLDPGMAFGTGTHPTTQLCLAALEDAIAPGVTVLDLGCGSGILAIGAVLLGAGKVLAVDIDPLAVEVTTENAQQNGVGEKIIAQEGDLNTVLNSARRFDVLVANILARTIIEMCQHHLGEVVRPGGKAIFSGIMVSQSEDVQVALRQTGLTPVNVRQDGNWVAIDAIRPHS
ncbi:MAG: 50S ribosomal protein L11 methyltransferase [Anaerolineae bacterium]|nr:50S ribosomal protein L11 methyltransferase [Anaerolineae bacterium]